MPDQNSLPGKAVVAPTLLPCVDRRAPTTKHFVGALQPTVGNSVGEAAPFPESLSMNMVRFSE